MSHQVLLLWIFQPCTLSSREFAILKASLKPVEHVCIAAVVFQGYVLTEIRAVAQSMSYEAGGSWFKPQFGQELSLVSLREATILSAPVCRDNNSDCLKEQSVIM